MIDRTRPIAPVAKSERRRSTDRGTQDDERFDVLLIAQGGIETEIHAVLFGDFAPVADVVRLLLARDVFTRQHLVHVNVLARRFADELGLVDDERRTLLRAAFLHDLGKIAIPDDLLMKPSSLTADEYVQVQRHAEIGETILTPYKPFKRVAAIVGQHHERVDGKGYPRGLRGDDIDPLARAISVLDAYSAMILPRPYHRGSSDDVAILELTRNCGTQFDESYVDAFVRMISRGR